MAWRSSAQSFFCTSPLEVLSIGAIEASKLLLHGNVLRKHHNVGSPRKPLRKDLRCLVGRRARFLGQTAAKTPM